MLRIEAVGSLRTGRWKRDQIGKRGRRLARTEAKRAKRLFPTEVERRPTVLQTRRKKREENNGSNKTTRGRKEK